MWKAAFSGRSDTGSAATRSSSQRQKSSGSSRKPEDDSRRSGKSSRGSTYGDDDDRSTYATAPSSRVGEPRSLTESAVRMLGNDEEEWEDEDKDARSERKSVRSDGRRQRRKSEKERSTSRSRDKSGQNRTSSRKDTETTRGKSRKSEEGDERALPDMGSFEQFPGQYAGGTMGGGQEPMMSGALPTPNNQFGLNRADSYGAAADYYLDEGQSVTNQPGVRSRTPNMLVNTDLHLTAPSAQAQPAQDTGHGSAADFYSGKISPVLTAEPQSIGTGKPSSSSRPSKTGKTSSFGTAVAATAAGVGLGAIAGKANSYQSRIQSSSTSYQQTSGSSSKPYTKPTRQSTDPGTSGSNGVYYASPAQQGPSSGATGKQSSSSNAGLYAAGAAAAGFAAYEMNQNHQQNSATPSISPYGGTAYGRPPGYGQQQGASMNGGMQQQQQQQHFHEHKGPMARFKDGLFNLISSEEDTIKMEMYTEYIGVCKYCFDPRSSPYDAPRRHHYHDTSRGDSFEDLRKRKSIDKMRRSSREQLGRTGSTRVDKDSRYYPERRKSSSKTDLVGAGIAAAGVAAGANALFNSDRRDFDDTYSIKSGHREGSSARRRSRSSSREKRRRSSYGVTGRDSKDGYVNVRTADGRMERRKAQRSRSRSGDRTSTFVGAAAGAALGASAISAAGRSRRSRDQTPNGTSARRRSRSGSSSGSQRGGIFSSFFSPPRRKRRGSRPERQQRQQGFFNFGNGSAVSSDSELAFGASRTDLSLRRKSSTKSMTKRRRSNDNIAATVAGIGATAAALAAAQNGQRISKRSSRPELGPGRVERNRQIARKQGKQSADDDEWEDELPSDVDDASSVGSDLAFGDYDRKLSSRQSRESFGSQSSAAGGLSAWGWRWGGKDQKRRRNDYQPPVYPEQQDGSGFGSAVSGAAIGTVAGAATVAATRPSKADSTYTSASSIPQQPMQYVDPRPLSDAGSLPGSRHASIPGSFDSPPYFASARPGPAPLQQPKPVTPIKPSFTQDAREFDDIRPSPRRTQSSPVQNNWGRDAALIGAAAVGTAAVIASQGRKSKDVRFGFTEEQERKHDDDRRREQQRADEERRIKDRERAVKEEAARATREQDVLRQRAADNKRAAEAELERQRAAERDAQQAAETKSRRERERREREDTYNREREERDRREREEARLSEEIERKKRELEGQQKRDRERRTQERRSSTSSKQTQRQADDLKSSEIPSAVAVLAGAAAVSAGGVVAERDRQKDERRNSKSAEKTRSRDAYVAQEITPPSVGGDSSFKDDALDDPDYFKRQRSRSPAEYARHVDDLARKAADKVKSANKVFEENDAYYAAPAQSQAEFFAPKEILSQDAEVKTRATDPIGSSAVKVFNAADLEKRNQFGTEWGGTFAKPSSFAPRGVPHLDLITPTPPPDATSKSRRARTPPSLSEPVGSQADDTDGETSGKKSARSRSISWGVDQTHVYDVPTPDSHVERDSYIQSEDLPAGAGAAAAGVAAAAVAGAALHGVVDKSATSSKDDTKRTYREEDLRRNNNSGKAGYQGPDEKTSSARDTPPVYRQPFYESVSDIGAFTADSPGTEGAPPVRGYVEGEVQDATPANDRAPRIPGGFDNDDDDEPSSNVREAATTTSSKSGSTAAASSSSAAKPAAEEVDQWEPPLSKKDKKKREKAAKRSLTLDDVTTPTSINTDVEPTARAAETQPEDDLDYYMSKKDKKKREKSAKRSSTVDSYTTPVSAQAETKPVAPEPQTQPEDDLNYLMSKKDKKKRDKAMAQAMSEDKTSEPAAGDSSAFVDEPAQITRDVEPEEEPAWEPPLSKKDKKKREKEAKKQGFADVAGTLMTAGGIAAVVDAVADDKTESPTSKTTKKGKKSREMERDIRDVEPVRSDTAEPDTPKSTDRQPSGMPGGWDSDSQAQSPADVIDPFQFQVHDDSAQTATAGEVDPVDEFADVKSKKKSKKRDSLKYSEPSTSSPLRSEIPANEDAVAGSLQSTDRKSSTNGYTATDRSSIGNTIAATDATEPERSTRTTKYAIDERPTDGRKRVVSPDDLRSVVSDPTGDRKSRTEDNGNADTSRSRYSAEPDSYEDSRSVAASEPVDPYEEARKSKRRSRREDDDTASVVSSRSRREKDESTSKDKKTGFFGLFGRKSWDNVPRTDDVALSRQSTKDSKDDDGEDGERKQRRRKHRSSEFGDDDDTRSVVSSSSRKHRSRSERDEESRDRYADDSYSTRNGDESERHHRRRRTDDDAPTEQSEKRHQRRHRTDDDSYEKDQSFLGMRVEDMPPLPDSRRESRESATQGKEQGHGNLVSAEPEETHSIDRDYAEAFDLVRGEASVASAIYPDEVSTSRSDGATTSHEQSIAFDFVRQGHHKIDHAESLEPSSSGDIGVGGKRLSWADDVNYLPALPDSTPGSPTAALSPEALERPTTLQRPTSMTAVPLRFPFGNQPVTPTQRVERAASFGGSLPTTPATPSSQKARQGRPGSTEFRPLYLVERNRKTPEIEDLLPSLPSSKPSSRASSMVGSDEYESAAEDVGSPERRRGLLIDTGFANRNWDDEEYLDSQQTTPRATHRPELESAKPPRQEPQFYTWEDYERDERMHNEDLELTEGPLQREHFDDSEQYRASESTKHQGEQEQLPALPPSRPSSRTASRSEDGTATGVLAAAAIGGAAVLGYQALQKTDKLQYSDDREPTVESQSESNELAAGGLVGSREVLAEKDEVSRDAFDDRPSFTQGSSSKKKGKKSKKGKKVVGFAFDDDTPETLPPTRMVSRDTDSFLADETMTEEGRSSGPVPPLHQASTKQPSHLDGFINEESALEAGGPQFPDQVPRNSVDSPTHAGSSIAEIVSVSEPLLLYSPSVDESKDSFDDSHVVDSERRGDQFHERDSVAPPADDVDEFMDAEQRIDVGNPDHVEDTTLAETPAVVVQSSQDQDEAAAAVLRPSKDESESQPEEFTFLPSRKLSKKEKKREQKAARQVIMDEPIAQSAESAEPSHAEEVDGLPKNTDTASPMAIMGIQTAALPALTQATSRDSHPFPGSPSLKSVPSVSTSTTAAHLHTSMESSESEAARRLSMSLREASTPSGTPADQVKDEPGVAKDKAATTKTAAPERPILRPEDSWVDRPTLSRKQSKKDKKKQLQAAKQAQGSGDVYVDQYAPETDRSATVDEADQLTATQSRQQHSEDTEEIRPEDIALPPEKESDLDDEPIPELPEGDTTLVTHDLPAVLDRQLAEIEPQFDTANSELAEPAKEDFSLSRDVNMAGPTLEESQEDSTVLQPKSSSLADSTLPTGDLRDLEEEPAPVYEPVDEFAWATSSKKKGKKGKKGKSAEVSEDPVPTDSETKPEVTDETFATKQDSVDITQTETADTGVDDTWAAFPIKKKKGKKGKETKVPDDSIATVTERERSQELTSETVVTAYDGADLPGTMDDDGNSWTGFSTKKKKGKKGKKATPVATPREEDEKGMIDQPEPTKHDDEGEIRDVEMLEPENVDAQDPTAFTSVPAKEKLPTEIVDDPSDMEGVSPNPVRIDAFVDEIADKVGAKGPEDAVPSIVARSTPAPWEEDEQPDTEMMDQRFFLSDPIPAEPETGTRSVPVSSSPLEDRDAIVPTQVATLTSLKDEEDSDAFWAPTPSKKKSKKGKKSKPVYAMLDEESDQVQHDSSVAVAQSVRSTDATLPDPEVALPVPDIAEAATDDQWAVPVKSKKGKKSKKTAVVEEPSLDMGAIQTADTDSTEVPSTRPTSESATPQAGSSDIETTDAWNVPAKGKKAKKSKKGKRVTLDLSAQQDATMLDGRGRDLNDNEALQTDEVTAAGDSAALLHFSAVDESHRDLSDTHATVESEVLDIQSQTPDVPEIGGNTGASLRDADPTAGFFEQPAYRIRSFDENPRGNGLVGEVFNYHNATTPMELDDHADNNNAGEEQDVEALPSALDRVLGSHQDYLDPIASTPMLQKGLFSTPGLSSDRLDDAASVPLPDEMDVDDFVSREPTEAIQDAASNERNKISEQIQGSIPKAQDSQEQLDFTADVASGLMDSGFNPNDFVQDPAFQRRSSPPGMVAEADPEEVSAASSKKSKKGKKGKKGVSTAFDSDTRETAPVSTTAVAGEREAEPAQAIPADDFNDTLEKTLAGTGFDAALLSQIAASSNDVSSNEVTGDNAEISFATSKRKKGKKGRDEEPTLPNLTHDKNDASIEHDNLSAALPDDPVPPFAVSGDREMDIDEMDNHYRTLKKNKRNKKKQKAAGGQSASEPETLSNERDDEQFQDKSSVAHMSLSSKVEADHEDEVSRSAAVDDIQADTGVSGYVAAAAGLSAAAAAAAGLEHVVRKKRSGGRTAREDNSPGGSERSLGLLPMDRGANKSVGPSWSFENLQGGEALPESPLLEQKTHEYARDSGYQEPDDRSSQRLSSHRGSQATPAVRNTTSHESLSSRRSAEPLHISTDDANDWNLKAPKTRAHTADDTWSNSLHARTPSREIDDTPLESTTKNRASYLFQTTPEILKDLPKSAGSPTPRETSGSNEYFDRTSTSSRDRNRDPSERMAFSPPPSGTLSPRLALDSIPEEQQALKRSIGETDAVLPGNTKAIRRTQTPQAIRAQEREFTPASMPLAISAGSGRSVNDPLSTDELIQRLPWPAVDDENSAVNLDRSSGQRRSKQAPFDPRSTSVMSNRSSTSAGQIRSPEELRSFSRTSNRSSTPTLRRISLSGDLRAASRRGDSGSTVGARSSPKTIPFEPPPTPPSNDDEVMDGGASRSADMSDVFQGVGDAQGSQVSPTRPPNMRKRQSMHIIDLENRLGQLAAENQALHESQQSRGISSDNPDYTNSRDLELQDKQSEIERIRAMLQPMQDEVSRLTEINTGLTEANRSLVDDSNNRYATLQEEHSHAQEQWQGASRELDDMRQEHDRLNSGMREIVETEIASRLLDKNAEIRQLREELDVASEQIRALQVQIQSTRGRDFLSNRDEDYFDGACQKLCQHVQQWVLRFSKMSDKLVCRLSSDLKDDKIEARLDNAILDGSDVDKLLGDRIKRRDVFMSVVMTMVWEYVFTRYLFGMDREQRQKLKALEKLLAEVGPPRAVAQWRATTLTLLAKRPAFAEQKNLDTEAVANELFALLCALLPPPSNTKDQLYSSLLRVITIAVDLSIEMRTQRAEYIMLPPLQPEYDTNGDLVRKVHFNASLMNERSGMFSSNGQLEESHAVVKIVLFPLVVKKGDEVGEGEEEIVVCPAQVLVHNENGKGKKIVRVQSGGIAMDVDDPRRSRQSLISAQGSMMF